VAEVVGEAGVTVEPRAIDGWAETIAALLADEGELDRLGAAALARSGEFTWEGCAAQMAAIYHDVAS